VHDWQKREDKGEEMTQTMYAHVNKWIKKKDKNYQYENKMDYPTPKDIKKG
jgi:hypothetical protein